MNAGCWKYRGSIDSERIVFLLWDLLAEWRLC